MCKINRAFCNATEPAAKYRDKLTYIQQADPMDCLT